MNLPTNSTSTAAALAALKQNLQGVRATLPKAARDPFLRLLKDGQWVFGPEDHPVKQGTEAVINPLSIMHGYTCWSSSDDPGIKNENLGEVMVPLSEAKPAKASLPNHGYPWKDQISFMVKFIEGTHKGTQVIYKASSEGAHRAADALLDLMIARLDENTSFICPIIQFEVDHYRHKKWGKTYVPVLNVVGWADLEGNEEEDGVAEPPQTPGRAEALPQPEPTPVRRGTEPEPEPALRRRAAAPEQGEVVDGVVVEPLRRRRR
jgi:hypothetical protein